LYFLSFTSWIQAPETTLRDSFPHLRAKSGGAVRFFLTSPARQKSVQAAKSLRFSAS
jgi:hypothetical protein